MAEHLTFNQGVVGSSPTRLTKLFGLFLCLPRASAIKFATERRHFWDSGIIQKGPAAPCWFLGSHFP